MSREAYRKPEWATVLKVRDDEERGDRVQVPWSTALSWKDSVHYPRALCFIFSSAVVLTLYSKLQSPGEL